MQTHPHSFSVYPFSSFELNLLMSLLTSGQGLKCFLPTKTWQRDTIWTLFRPLIHVGMEVWWQEMLRKHAHAAGSDSKSSTKPQVRLLSLIGRSAVEKNTNKTKACHLLDINTDILIYVGLYISQSMCNMMDVPSRLWNIQSHFCDTCCL